jgi:potassium efflux system protein
MDKIFEIWNIIVFEVDGQGISLGKLCIALIMIVFGYFMAQMFSSRIGRKLLSRLNVDESTKYSLERLIFYLAYCFIVLIVLEILRIPLTVFTFIGGALAIGIGFGSQNIVNNFISGLIVMFSQPLRVHDWVEIEGIFGEVVTIGTRSTILRLIDNKNVIIPNSYFLEKSFVNWTLNDRNVAASIQVGVAYGSDTEKVKSILIQAAKSHSLVLKDSEPSVFFQDFANSSLNFELFFRVEVKRDNTPQRIASDIRMTIDSAFRKHNIEIPFPHQVQIIKERILSN